MAMFWKDRDIEEGAAKVHLAEGGGTMDLGSEVSEEGEGVGISDGLLVERPEVRTRPDSAPLLGRQVERGTPISVHPWLDPLNDTFPFHLFPDCLPFLGLFGVYINRSSFCFAGTMVGRIDPVPDIMYWLACFEGVLQELRVSPNEIGILLIMHF